MTTTQVNAFVRELWALQRSAPARTQRGRIVKSVCADLLEDMKGGAPEDVLRAARSALGQHEELRRIRREGHDEGYEEGWKACLRSIDILYTNQSPKEDTQ